MLKVLARQYGFLVGPPSGAVAFAAYELAKNLTSQDTVVMLFGDSGRAYLSKEYYTADTIAATHVSPAVQVQPALHMKS